MSHEHFAARPILAILRIREKLTSSTGVQMSARSGRRGADEVKAARAELHNVLVKKLIARYGTK